MRALLNLILLLVEIIAFEGVWGGGAGMFA